MLTGASGAGKSALADDIALGAAIAGANVAVFSLDMKARLRAESIGRGFKEARGLSIAIDDSPAPTIEQVEARARRMLGGAPCDMVLIDYMQLMDVRGSRGGEVFETCAVRRLKGVATRLDAAVLAVAQTASPAAIRACSAHADFTINLTGCKGAYHGRVVKNRLGGVGALEIPLDEGGGGA